MIAAYFGALLRSAPQHDESGDLVILRCSALSSILSERRGP